MKALFSSRGSAREPVRSPGRFGRGFVAGLAVLTGWKTGQARAAESLTWTRVGPDLRMATLRAWSGEARVRFTLVDPAASGVHFTNLLRGDLSLTNAVAHNGSGVAVGDVDGDDWPDLYFCSLEGLNRLFRNLGGWRFVEMPADEAACTDQLSAGAALADVDGDGDSDLLVNGIAAGTRLFLNDGRGHFTEAQDTGLSRTASPTSLTDIDCAHAERNH